MEKEISKTRIKNSLYKVIQPLTSHLYRDDDWLAVSNVFANMRNVLNEFAACLSMGVSVEDGGYRENKGAKWKEYRLAIEDGDGKEIISGTLNAHAAGSVSDPFGVYDMSVVLW